MSQFPNQNELIEYRGRQQFEQPLQPAVYQEQMPILPTPSFRIGYSGINLAEIGMMAAKAGSSIAENLYAYDVKKKQQALESIFSETNDTLENQYRQGASKEEVEATRTQANAKIKTALGFDPEDQNLKENDFGVQYGNLLVASRKGLSSLGAKNAQYTENKRASDYVNNAVVAALQVDETFAQNPNAPIETYDVGIESIRRMLGSILGPNAEVNSSSILAIQNVADKESALKAYGILVKLQEAKAKALVDQEKAKAEFGKDQFELEQENRKTQNERLRDTLTSYSAKAKGLKEQIAFFTNIPIDERTDEQSAQLSGLITQYLQLQEDVQNETAAFAYARYSDESTYPINLSDILRERSGGQEVPLAVDTESPYRGSYSYDSEFFDRIVIGDAAVDTPPVRTAYGTFLDEMRGVEESIGRVRLDMVKKAKEEAKKAISDRWKGISGELDVRIAESDTNGTLDRDRSEFLTRLNNFNSATIDTLMGYLGSNRIQEIYNTQFKIGTKLTLADGTEHTVGTYEEESKKGFPSLKMLLDLNTPPEQEAVISELFQGNSAAYDSWKDASLEFKRIQAKIFKADSPEAGRSAARKKQQEISEAVSVLLGTRSNTNITPATYTEASDYMLSQQLGPSVDFGNFDSVKQASLQASTTNNEVGVPVDVMLPSRMFSTVYQGASTAEELISTIGRFLPKDKDGKPLVYRPSPWSSTVSSSSFAAIETIKTDLQTKDRDSAEYRKALAAFALLPKAWRIQVINSTTEDIQLREVDSALTDNPSANLTTVLSIASRNGYSNEAIESANTTAQRVVSSALFSKDDFTAPRPNETDAQVEERKVVVNALIEELKKGAAASTGFVFKDNLELYKRAENKTRDSFKYMLERAVKYYELYRNDRPEAALNLAIQDAIKDFTSYKVVTPRGIVSRGNVKADYVGAIDSSRIVPDGLISGARMYSGQPNNSAVLDQDIVQFVTDRTNAPVYINGAVIPTGKKDSFLPTFGVSDNVILANNKSNKDQVFADMVITSQNRNSGISLSTRRQLMRMRFEEKDFNEANEKALYSELINATKVGTTTTTRRDVLVSAAVLKEIELAMQTPSEALDTFEEVLAFAQTKADQIRVALKDSKDSPTADSPYTVQFTSGGLTKKENGELEQTYSLELLKKEPDGSYRRMSNLQEGLESASFPNYTVRGNSTNVEVLSSVGDVNLYTKPTQNLERDIQALYDKGLLVGNFKYRILKPYGDSSPADTTRAKDFEASSFLNIVPIIEVKQDPQTKKVTITRKFEEQPTGISRNYGATKGMGPDIKAVLENTPQFTEEESLLKEEKVTPSVTLPVTPTVTPVNQEKLSEKTLAWNRSVSNLARGVDYQRPWQTAFRSPREGKLTVLDPNTSIESGLPFPDLPISDNNKPNYYISYDKKQELYFVIPDPYKIEPKYNEKSKHIGAFVNREDAQFYLRKLQTFMESPNNTNQVLKSAVQKPQTSPLGVTRSEVPFMLYDVKSARDYYESIYGPEVTNELFRQASEQQAVNQDRFINGIPIRSRFPDFNSWYTAKEETADKRLFEKYNIVKPEYPTSTSKDYENPESIQAHRERVKRYDSDFDKYYSARSAEFALMSEEEKQITLPTDVSNIPNYNTADMTAQIWESEYKGDSVKADPIYYQDSALALQTQNEETGKPEVYFSNELLKDKTKTKVTGLHELIHVMQRYSGPTAFPIANSIFKTDKELNSDEFYVLNPFEIPAWLGQLKAEYYLETNTVLYPKSNEEEYSKFFAWIKEKDTNSETQQKYKVESFYGILHRMLTNPDQKIKDVMGDILRQVAFDSSIDGATAII